MRLYVAIIVAAVMAYPALAQVPTDQEIANAHALCNKPENFVPIGVARNRPPNAGQYKPEWKRCEAIDAEYAKRELERKKKEKSEQDHLDSLLNRIPKQ